MRSGKTSRISPESAGRGLGRPGRTGKLKAGRINVGLTAVDDEEEEGAASTARLPSIPRTGRGSRRRWISRTSRRRSTWPLVARATVTLPRWRSVPGREEKGEHDGEGDGPSRVCGGAGG